MQALAAFRGFEVSTDHVLASMYHCRRTCSSSTILRHEIVTQVPALNIFESSYRRGKFDASRKLSNGGLLEFQHIYPMDAVYDTPELTPEDVSSMHIENHHSLVTCMALSMPAISPISHAYKCLLTTDVFW